MNGRPGALALAALLGACAAAGPRPPALSPASNIAVLPLDNETTDLDGPAQVRASLNRRLRADKGYQTFRLESVDSVLTGLGISEGGQLRAVTPQKLGESLGAQAVMYGTLLEFGGPTTGFINVRKVKAAFRLVRCSDGALLWEGEGEFAEGKGVTTGTEAVKAGARALAGRAAEKSAGTYLATETEMMLYEALRSLPRSR